MIDAGIEFGPGTVYGSALIKVGQAQQRLGQSEREFVNGAYRGFVEPLRKFLDEDMRSIMKERKVLEQKRLDLDMCKNRLRKAKTMEAQNNVRLPQNGSIPNPHNQFALINLLSMTFTNQPNNLTNMICSAYPVSRFSRPGNLIDLPLIVLILTLIITTHTTTN